MVGNISIAIHGFWISATSMDGGSAEEDMESSTPIPAEMTHCVDTYALWARVSVTDVLCGF